MKGIRDVAIDADPILFTLASPQSEAWKGSLKGESITKASTSIKKLKKAFKRIVREYKDIAEIESIANDWTVGKVHVCISDVSNFRYDIFPEYKANRKGSERTPEFLKLREWARKKYAPNANLEADDVVAYHVRNGAVGFSLDKDLLKAVEGTWFDTYHARLHWVYTSKKDADRFHLMQCVAGDPTDGIKGISGVAMKTAEKLLDEHGWSWSGVKSIYLSKDLTIKDAVLTTRLVSMMQWNGKKIKLFKDK